MSRTSLPAGIRLLPRKALSRAVGGLARIPLPPPLLVPVLAAYARVYGVDLQEAARPLGAYTSFLDFFTRELRPGLRPLPSDPEAIVSPADGKVHACGRIEAGCRVEAKGVTYDVPTLVAERGDGDRWRGGSHLAIHLSPADYHRFHWPFDAAVDRVAHLPGDLWPVHRRAVTALPGLLARNERVVVEGRLAANDRPFAIAAIGALNVGSIRLAVQPLRTNRGAPARIRRWDLDGRPVRRGDEMGFFEMGSALALLLAPDAGSFVDLEAGRPLRVGQAIGRTAGPTA